ncbi:amidohydrolase [Acinetobacter haemolyticus]|uniref:amidohydrolase n=1 Tax=Acinetobacter haemolyticus TaxID=29430 RepID=UPI000E58B5F2|nr:amidohydrolase [Acinetobacter haemolyticus]NAR51239.1 amidohydrolase family protein [Acinetobacter haemolyticus]NAR56410.1 amidohydrolase family protein [Acinetobacter haemolyticus]NAR59640.1 amidohydrolase family protein [Acinetobacter haemolyticus]NAR68936.1 amidohydrolase family protein [Acinetobacter haemolyticus]NAR81501.1 amidohydrolase family protein [Acinetobacter haemolyticus]
MTFKNLNKLTLAMIIGFTLSGCVTSPNETVSAEKLFYGGPILTMEGMTPEYVEALLVKDGKIVYAGPKKQAESLIEARAQYIDLKNRTLLPSFIDAHSHVNMVGFHQMVANLYPAPDGQVSDIDSLVQVLTQWKKQNPKVIETMGGWILGNGYDDAQLSEQRHPTATDLDRVSKDQPVMVLHQSGHLASVNHKALALSKIDQNTTNPAGGVIRREANSNVPNGVLEESALFTAIGSIFKDVPAEVMFEIARKGLDAYVKNGFTTVQEGRADQGTTEMWQALAKQNQLPIDVVSYPDITTSQDYMLKQGSSLKYHQHFRIGGVKISLDGSPQGKTAWLTQAYVIPPEGKDQNYKGYPAIKDDQQVNQYINLAFEQGWQVLAHANGDAAIDQFIGAVKDATAKQGKADRRSVLIHSQTIRDDQLDQLKALDIIPSFFSLHTYYWGDWHRQQTLGETRAAHISPTATALKKNLIFTEHHDAPVVPPHSMMMIDATVNRLTRTNYVLGKNERVSPYFALKSITDWAAYQYFEEQSKGTLTKGKLADLVILEHNPLTVPNRNIKDIQILATYKEGQLIYTNSKN